MLALFCSACTQDAPEDVSISTKDPTLCDFKTGRCSQSVAGVQLELLITPYNTPSEKPLTVELIGSEALNDLVLRVEGRDMFMGVIPVNLTKVSKTEYNGQLIYGSCSSNYMVWRAFASFTKNGEQHVAMFDFLADSPG
nr:hypothetical protein [uncultured Shewanella sp.]